MSDGRLRTMKNTTGRVFRSYEMVVRRRGSRRDDPGSRIAAQTPTRVRLTEAALPGLRATSPTATATSAMTKRKTKMKKGGEPNRAKPLR